MTPCLPPVLSLRSRNVSFPPGEGWAIVSSVLLCRNEPEPLCCRCLGLNNWISENITRGPRTLALCLTAAVGMTLAIFCRLVSKTHCCRLNQLKCGLTLTPSLTRHTSVLDHIRHLNFDLSGSFKVTCECHWTPIYGFLLMFNSVVFVLCVVWRPSLSLLQVIAFVRREWDGASVCLSRGLSARRPLSALTLVAFGSVLSGLPQSSLPAGTPQFPYSWAFYSGVSGLLRDSDFAVVSSVASIGLSTFSLDSLQQRPCVSVWVDPFGAARNHKRLELQSSSFALTILFGIDS